ncbi:hypothetical protein BDA96_03G129300 [Sorghum bicolor]|jgi:hypothetical protein|uniref:Uncharacterized protein n=2 Tax=Sorghum bicolor TaxID=4558 RepID=A0A921RC59_SORBI|nr:uncharacterized protein LOC8054626 [Sorghum bicolor]EES00539.1 hypothetical protein SORBI_3003G123800 [Sorghum bicolor]KAG0537215.1 hypothetical protein BDA96_03G129300 [Sorghum bicolor]|eukprot:XP_002455419.1 uncharacterized protein LOC8054626 [Sorghum bicolor]
MASIMLLLSELLGGESASVLAAERYMGGQQSLRELRSAAVTGPAAAAANKQDEQRPEAAAAGTARCECQETRNNEESLGDLAVSRVAVDLIMWP